MPDLAGLRILVTRAAHQAEELASHLRALGAEALLLPMIGIAPPKDITPLRASASRFAEYDWIIFTSTNAVHAFAAQLASDSSKSSIQAAAIGAATRRAAEQAGFCVALTPTEYVAESLIEAFQNHDLQQRRVLIPSAAVSRDLVPAELRRLGATVHVVEAYRNIIPPDSRQSAQLLFEAELPDWITFASPSAVHNLIEIVGTSQIAPIPIASIGPLTSTAVRNLGLDVGAEAQPHTIPGLVAAIVKAHRGRTE